MSDNDIPTSVRGAKFYQKTQPNLMLGITQRRSFPYSQSGSRDLEKFIEISPDSGWVEYKSDFGKLAEKTRHNSQPRSEKE
jgi:hypothetical protein